ncbi:MAG: beta-ketoacyl synthase N-terminal-like domain-containing protein, partial [Candidatus Margulisiibacteriota bacterium]
MSVSIIDFSIVSPLGIGQDEHWANIFDPRFIPQYKLGKNEFELIDELYEPLKPYLEGISPERVAVVVSNSKYNFGKYSPSSSSIELDFFAHALSSYLAAKIGSGAIPYAISAACATGLISVMKGCEFLQDQTVDVVIAGSVEASNIKLMEAAFDQMGVLSQSERMSPFSTDRDGFVLGEGGALFILRRTNDVQNAYAKIAGFSYVNDATNPTQFDRRGFSIKRAIRQAMERADIDQIHYVNAHGTATLENDQLEADVFNEVFGGENKPYISSTK